MVSTLDSPSGVKLDGSTGTPAFPVSARGSEELTSLEFMAEALVGVTCSILAGRQSVRYLHRWRHIHTRIWV